jgi:hypothetical protein
MTEHTGSQSLFAIFALSLYSLFLIPYTIYCIFNGEDVVVQPYAQARRERTWANSAGDAPLTPPCASAAFPHGLSPPSRHAEPAGQAEEGLGGAARAAARH